MHVYLAFYTLGLTAIWLWPAQYNALLSYTNSFTCLELTRPGFVTGPLAIFLIFMICYYIYAGLQEFMDRRPDGPWAKYKLHRRDALTFRQMLPTVVFNQFLWLGAMCVMWNLRWGMRTTVPGPPASEVFLHSFLHYLAYETLFYTVHRLMHTPQLYPIHVKHHWSRGSIGLSGQFQSVPDFFLTTIFAHAVTITLLDIHSVTIWFMTVVGSLNTVHSHGAYHFPYNLFPDPHDHNLHHWQPWCNFGTGPLDYLLGTMASTPSPAPFDTNKSVSSNSDSPDSGAHITRGSS